MINGHALYRFAKYYLFFVERGAGGIKMQKTRVKIHTLPKLISIRSMDILSQISATIKFNVDRSLIESLKSSSNAINR